MPRASALTPPFTARPQVSDIPPVRGGALGIQYQTADAAGWHTISIPGVFQTAGEPVQITVQHDNTTVRVYRNGRLLNATQRYPLLNYDNAQALLIGTRKGNEFWLGNLSDVTIHSGADAAPRTATRVTFDWKLPIVLPRKNSRGGGSCRFCAGAVSGSAPPSPTPPPSPPPSRLDPNELQVLRELYDELGGVHWQYRGNDVYHDSVGKACAPAAPASPPPPSHNRAQRRLTPPPCVCGSCKGKGGRWFSGEGGHAVWWELDVS